MPDQIKEAWGILFARIFAHQAVKVALDQQRLRDDATPYYLAELERITAQLESEVSAARKAMRCDAGILDTITAARQRIANDEVEPLQ
ncbi:hypothetical protein E9232_006088 [Inquilinus ginsengisoli]|uniref:Uncharacterized protein n=1 Tax=Inquilinus ginsengisoli TaxID=363840 RepID=A0ABU1JY29_9PROT|nr:hypothetical protein [Inquilinus ginsengisoli]MDR6293537.1 hypothetical protein [Inquilinus ginsengisoli]